MSTEVPAVKLGLDASKQGLCFICERELYFITLEEALRSLKYEREELMKLMNYVQSRYQEIRTENPPRLISYNLNAWVERVVVLVRDQLGRVIEEAEEEIRSKCVTFICPKNLCNCNAVGNKVTSKLEYVKELLKDGQKYADAVDAIPNTISLHLRTGRNVPVDGLLQTDKDAITAEA